MTSPAIDRPHPAVVHARRVVGLYGDSGVTWSIVLAAELAEPRSADEVEAALADLVARNPHLGSAAPVVRFTDESAVLGAFADTPYGDQDPLLRVAVSADERMLVVAGHHGALDGLGLLGAASVLAGVDLGSSARGIDRETQPGGFLRRSATRLAEALLRPPLRLAAAGGSGTGDLLVARTVEAHRPGSAALVAAAATTVRRWNADHGDRRTGRLVISMGLSRRPGTPVAPPDRDTAYVRLIADGVDDIATASQLLAATEPEPAFPENSGGGVGPAVIKLLRSRLGATVLVSNLGRIADPGVRAVRFWPVVSGPAGCAIGLASAGGTTTVTVRVSRSWFSAQEAHELSALVAAELAAQ